MPTRCRNYHHHDMRQVVKTIIHLVLAFYILVSCYVGFLTVQKILWNNKQSEETYDDPDWNPFGDLHRPDHDIKVTPFVPPPDGVTHTSIVEDGDLEDIGAHLGGTHTVEIWGKAAIGLYLWQDIMGCSLQPRMGGVWSYGTKQVGSINFIFRTGPGVTTDHVPSNVENLVIILNGREDSKVDFSKTWLESLKYLKKLVNVAVVLLGNESCRNEWIYPYLKKNGGIITLVFVVYDSQEIDEETFFHWPLGVATYRDFPPFDSSDTTLIEFPRKYKCNFLGTVYAGSSREKLLGLMKKLNLEQSCYVKARTEWKAQETDGSKDEYTKVLKASDLTLHPVGMNSECYRLYEALSFGSVPVIEDLRTPGNCSPKGPFQLLKHHNIPAIFIKDWNELEGIMKNEQILSDYEKYQRRKAVIEWYGDFLHNMQSYFVKTIQKKFSL